MSRPRASVLRVIDEAVITEVARRLHDAAPSSRIVLFWLARHRRG